MGRGSAYRYNHFMLVDECWFMYGSVDEDGETITGEPKWDDEAWDMLLDDIVDIFKAFRLKKTKYWSKEAYIFAEGDRFNIGVDTSGGLPCIFVEPKTWSRSAYSEEKEYNIDRVVRLGFNKLILRYNGAFRKANGAWMSEAYGPERLYG